MQTESAVQYRLKRLERAMVAYKRLERVSRVTYCVECDKIHVERYVDDELVFYTEESDGGFVEADADELCEPWNTEGGEYHWGKFISFHGHDGTEMRGWIDALEWVLEEER